MDRCYALRIRGPRFLYSLLATVKGELGVAVTFSVAKEHYEAYKSLFDSVVKTLRVFLIENKDITNFSLAERGGKAAGDLSDDFVGSERPHGISRSEATTQRRCQWIWR